MHLKLSDTELSSNIDYFKERLKIPYTYKVIKKENIDTIKMGHVLFQRVNF